MGGGTLSTLSTLRETKLFCDRRMNRAEVECTVNDMAVLASVIDIIVKINRGVATAEDVVL